MRCALVIQLLFIRNINNIIQIVGVVLDLIAY
jgi:hypothetical protein